MRTPTVWMLLPLLAACAGTAPSWQKSGAGETAINEDLQQCRMQVGQAPDPSILTAPVQTSGTPLVDRGQEQQAGESQRIRKCMEGKGYSLTR